MSKKREKTLDLKKVGKQGFPTKIQLFDQTNVSNDQIFAIVRRADALTSKMHQSASNLGYWLGSNEPPKMSKI